MPIAPRRATPSLRPSLLGSWRTSRPGPRPACRAWMATRTPPRRTPSSQATAWPGGPCQVPRVDHDLVRVDADARHARPTSPHGKRGRAIEDGVVGPRFVHRRGRSSSTRRATRRRRCRLLRRTRWSGSSPRPAARDAVARTMTRWASIARTSMDVARRRGGKLVGCGCAVDERPWRRWTARAKLALWGRRGRGRRWWSDGWTW